MTPPPGIVEQTVEPGWLRWILTKPGRRNAVDPAMLAWIGERSRSLRGEVVVLTGDGDRAFCSGFDLTSFDEQVTGPPDRPLIEATRALEDADATFVAEIRGAAVGAGVELAAACDLRLARHGVRFRVPAGMLGVVYHADGVQRIHAMFGPALTGRLLLLGHEVTAEETVAAGGILEVHPDQESLRAAVDACVRRLRSMAPLSLRGNRDALRRIGRPPLPPGFVAEHERRRTEAYDGEDHREARAALAEGRPPQFRGK